MGAVDTGLTKGVSFSLTTEVSLRFAFVLIVAIVGSSTLCIQLESAGVERGVEMLEEFVLENELQSMHTRIVQLSRSASSLFLQAKSDAELMAEYAVNNMNGTLANARYSSGLNSYVSYKIVAPDVSSMLYPPGSVSEGVNSDIGETLYSNNFYSGWFAKGAYTYLTKTMTDDWQYADGTAILDNAFVPLLAANPNYAEVYIGTETGVMRKLPWYDVSSYQYSDKCQNDSSISQGYACMYYNCTARTNQFQHGYDPTCRTWYGMAKADPTSAILSPPYVGASRGLTMITAAKAVRVNDTTSFIGATGIDIYIDTLSDSVLAAKVLEEGYTYLIDSDLSVVMHPDSSSSSVQKICELEFASCTSDDATTYDSTLQTFIDGAEIGQWKYYKEGDPWWMTYAPVNGTDYFIVMTVSEEKINETAEQIKIVGDSAVTGVIIVSVLLGAAGLCFGVWFSCIISKKISAPVEGFNQVLDNITHDQMDDINLDMSASEFKQINKLQSRILSLFLAVKFSTNAYYQNDFSKALHYLNEVEHMFQTMKQKAAVGVVLNNKGEILRSYAKTQKSKGGKEKFHDALEASLAAVDNAKQQAAENDNKILVLDQKRARQGIREGTPEGEKYRSVENKLRRKQLALGSVIASRLNNYAVCLKDAGQLEEALEASYESFSAFERADDLLGLIKSLGNRGLIYLELENRAQSEQVFMEAYRMAHSKFTNEPDHDSCSAFQYSCMNLGTYYKSLIEAKWYDGEPKSDALQYYYYAITVSNHVNKDVLGDCVRNIYSIYDKHFDGELSHAAKAHLTAMFPTILAEAVPAKVAFLVDVSPSMNAYQRINKAVTVLTDIFANKLRNGDFFALDTFARAHNKIILPTTIDSNNRAVIADSIYALQYACNTGCTHFFKALKEYAISLKELAGSKENCQGSKYTVLALTDGEDNEYRTTMGEVKGLYKDLGITLIVVTLAVGQSTQNALRRDLLEKDEFLLTAQDDASSLFQAMSAGFEMAAGGHVTMESL